MEKLRILSENNSNCADCLATGATWYNFHLGVFVCVNCAGVHRSINQDGVRVKSTLLDKWNSDEIAEAARSGGNNNVNEKLECSLPYFFSKLGDATAPEIRKEFILHKYVRRTFENFDNFSKYAPRTGRLEGSLEKKGKDKLLWKERHFVLTPISIQYYIERRCEAKGTIDLNHLEWHIETNESPSCIVLTQLSRLGISGRNYYVRSLGKGRDAAQLFDWYFGLMAARHSCTPTPIDIFCGSTTEYGTNSKYGNLYKVGSHSADLWKQRWFVLNGAHLTYAKTRLSHSPQGDTRIGSSVTGYKVELGTAHLVRAPTKFTFQLVTPARTYKLCAETAVERDGWMEALSQIIT